MTIKLTKSVVGAVVLATILAVQGWALYTQHRWLHETVGTLENGTVVTRAMLVDALIQKNFVAPKPQASPTPPVGEVK